MKWTAQDVAIYIKSKEYIDTAIIPLLPVTFGEDMKGAASRAEFITLLSAFLEREFAGRLMLLPPFTYLKTDENEQAIVMLKQWSKLIQDNGLPHIFYLTSETEWKLQEGNLEGTLLWVPALPFEQLDDSQKWAMVDSQAKQLVNFFTQKWGETNRQ